MILPPSAFAEAFREHVMPLLRREIIVQGAALATGNASWHEASGSVMALALSRGAGRMRASHFDELSDWIGAALITEADKSDAIGAETDDLAAQCLRLPFPEAKALVRKFIHGE